MGFIDWIKNAASSVWNGFLKPVAKGIHSFVNSPVFGPVKDLVGMIPGVGQAVNIGGKVLEGIGGVGGALKQMDGDG